MGFCLLGNAAIAARYAQRRHGLQQVLIFDFDVHHGNGTQTIFDADPSVLFISTHMNSERGIAWFGGVGCLADVVLSCCCGRVQPATALAVMPSVFLPSF